jgi:TrkA domain protein
MVDVNRVKLPGVGVLHSFYTDDGGKCGVITHRSGHSDLISFADVADGADRSDKVSLRLSEDEAHTLAELLGGTRITEGLSKLDEIPGLSIDWFSVDYEDTIAGKPLGDLARVGIIGVTVVAVVRGDSANPAPSGDFVVFPGDTIVVAGSPEKVGRAFSHYRSGALTAASVETPPGG